MTTLRTRPNDQEPSTSWLRFEVKHLSGASPQLPAQHSNRSGTTDLTGIEVEIQAPT